MEKRPSFGKKYSFRISYGSGSLLLAFWDFATRRSHRRLRKDLLLLKTKIWLLEGYKRGVAGRMHREQGPQMKPFEEVKSWQLAVDLTLTEATELREEAELLDRSGGCSLQNWRSTHRMQRRTSRALEELEALLQKGEFKMVTGMPFAEVAVHLPVPKTVGLDSQLKDVWEILVGDSSIRIVGLYGPEGIGKTTLLKLINNKFISTRHDFDVVIWVTVSEDDRVKEIQDQIWERLGLPSSGGVRWEDKAADIFSALCGMKFMLLLDDVWDRVDLLDVGVPLQLEQSGSKVIFTARSRVVCREMKAERIIQMHPLLGKNAVWDLFAAKFGVDTLGAYPDIFNQAQHIFGSCSNLPLLITTMAGSMAGNNDPAGCILALKDLDKLISRTPDLEHQVFFCLKFCYDHLPSDTVRSCFLYCALFPTGFEIMKDDLIDYWICDKLLGDSTNGVDTHHEGSRIIGILCSASLLEDGGKHVKMSKIIHDMAIRVASQEGNLLVQLGPRFVTAPEIGKWEGVRRVSLMGSSIENLTEVPECPDLLTLFLSHNRHLFCIPDGFFQSMHALTILDLSQSGIRELPRGISNLLSLQYFNLSHTFIEQLPAELKMLLNLKYLNLEHNHLLEMIPQNVISSLLLLQVLRTICCGYSVENVKGNILSDEIYVEELQHLEKLSTMSITLRDTSALHRFLVNNKLLGCTQALSLERISGSNLLDISSLAHMKQLELLLISNLKDVEELIVDQVLEEPEIQAASSFYHLAFLPERCFNSLQEVRLEMCCRLHHLTWLILAPNLTVLQVTKCENMQDIILREKLGDVPDDGKSLKIFEKLEILVLRNLPRLAAIYRCHRRIVCGQREQRSADRSYELPFISLRKIQVLDCPELLWVPHPRQVPRPQMG